MAVDERSKDNNSPGIELIYMEYPGLGNRWVSLPKLHIGMTPNRIIRPLSVESTVELALYFTCGLQITHDITFCSGNTPWKQLRDMKSIFLP